LVGLASAATFPTVVVLDALGRLTFPAWLAPVGLFVAGLFGLWAVMLLLARAEYR
jgi:heme A synthase